MALVRDKNNRYDPNAVAVAFADDYDGNPDEFDFNFIIGYIPRNENEALARMIDAGYGDKFSANITTYRNYGNVNSRIRISIFIKSQTPMPVRSDLLRGVTLNFDLFRDLTKQLEDNGMMTMRYFVPVNRQIIEPIEGEKVVAIYEKDPEYYVLYLLRVMAIGDKCAKYIDNYEGCDYDDDCVPYVLSNICGPVLIKKAERNFLSRLDVSDLTPGLYLNEIISASFERIFERILLRPLNRNNIDMDPSLDDPEERV